MSSPAIGIRSCGNFLRVVIVTFVVLVAMVSATDRMQRSVCCPGMKLMGDIEVCDHPCCTGLTEVAMGSPRIGLMVLCQAAPPPPQMSAKSLSFLNKLFR